ncbi:neuronal acetylcholine receptor subunit alpha-10-like isoform X3 [Montipora capricornis]|uniref:neuronal acetylcholine receptor subunit alpha-10-like isoform X3 n=1 Tax=Montipora capricornis TaxID=246305 RepID=UPI0035F18F52
MAQTGYFKLSSIMIIFKVLLLTLDVQFRSKSFVKGASGMDETELVDRVISITNTNVRPVNNSLDAVNVTLDITFHGVIDMDEKYQILTTDIWLRQEWTNQMVKWNPADFGGLKQITIDSSQIWQPDIVLYNNVFEEFDGRMDNVKTRVRVHNDGYCYWAAPFVFKTSCRFDVRDFPYDEQRCELKFGSWLFHSKQLDLFRKQENAPVAKDRVDNGEWKVTSIEIEKNTITYDCCPNERYPDITFVINLQRRSLFYTYNLVVPNFLIALLAFFSFYIPVECGERISFVITVLLSMTVFLLLVAESIPPTSEAVPVIGMFFTSSIIEVALALVATGISLKVYYSYLYGSGLSPGLRKLLFHRIAPLLRVDTSINGQKDHCENKSCMENPFGFLKKLKERATRDSDISMYTVPENKGKGADGTPTIVQANDMNLFSLDTGNISVSDVMNSHDDTTERELRKRNNRCDPLSSELQLITSVVKDHKDSEKRAAECRVAAAIVDRAFMLLFVLVFFLSAITILLLPFIKK